MSLHDSDQLSDWLESQVHRFQNTIFRPDFIEGPFGRHGCTYDKDEDGLSYVTIGFNLPPHVFAEIEDGTYGSLQGFRIYTDPGEQAGYLLLTPQEWCERKGVEIMDADGWRGTMAKDINEPIDEDEFDDRLSFCTTRRTNAT